MVDPYFEDRLWMIFVDLPKINIDRYIVNAGVLTHIPRFAPHIIQQHTTKWIHLTQ